MCTSRRDAAALAAAPRGRDDRQVAHRKALPPEVVEQVVAKTDGVPLFVEELTKMVLESGLLQEASERYELTGPPPAGHSRHAARLADGTALLFGNRQGPGTSRGHLGREFSYTPLQAVSPWDQGTLQRGSHKLVEAEFLDGPPVAGGRK